MPTLTQIDNAIVPFTQEMADRLIPALRGCALYARNRALYTDVATLVNAIVGQSTDKAKILSAVYELVLTEGIGGAVALSGGSQGVAYSETAERENELAYALDALIDRPVGATLDGMQAFGSVNLANTASW